MATIVRCDNCSAETTYPVVNWYKVERWAYPDHTSKKAQPGPWHLCSMQCIGELFSTAEKLEITKHGDREPQFIEQLPEKQT